ncbi:MAG: molybdenum cofactor biosynthesis protein MoaE [Candidatus Hydrogenedentes bacterium]|jgi:molybdopterin synthase catalytic subunit|nr:molybdenum cofactor biosynthesis protein MoaE [Candidatus Hydrogenedentota bacterium]
MFSIGATRIDVAALHADLEDPAAGACVTFEGWVRNENEGSQVQSLEYEGYEAVAVKEGEKILAEAVEQFQLSRAICVHRIGHLQIGDMAVWVGVSSGHRGEAFKACTYIIDEIKTRLPVWKKEHYIDGDSGWINCEVRPAAKN